jgi:DNA-directed RNA polymerase subunit RPC12/RpoP
MYLIIHTPLFGASSVEAKPIECPTCPRGAEHGVNDWVEQSIATCDPGDRFTCARCGVQVIINWGLVEPDHLSTWKNSEHCSHRLCVLMAQRIKAA